jgi:glucose/arabinose dehydrogenase
MLALCIAASATTLPPGFIETQVAFGISSPTAMALAPDGRLFVCEEGGSVRIIKNGSLLPAPFVTVNTDASNERGLLGIAFDPAFATNHFVYLYYTAPAPVIHHRVSRLTANGDVAVVGSEVIILELDNQDPNSNHCGGAIHFGPDGKLYIATGDDNVSSNSQSFTKLLGKVLRLNSDGSIPGDNPFFATASGNYRAIWALGLRNPFTFAIQPGTGRLFINDVGDTEAEELNDGIAGSNYGWPACEGPCSPPNPSFRDPLYSYGHGIGCAIVGAAFYNPTASQFPAEYIGKYFFTDLCSGAIRRFDPATNTVADFVSGVALPTNLLVSADGSLYYLERGGVAYRIQFDPAPGNFFRFNAAGYSVSESQSNLVITVLRTGDTSAAAAVNFATSDRTASERSDYTAALGTLNFAAGETSRTFSVLISDDAYVEADETITLTLSNATTGGSIVTSVLTIEDNDTGVPNSNPADNVQFFVRQHYHDFLGREPDDGGFTYWTGQISQCGGDPACIRTKRIDVSDAFSFEAEYQQTGAYVLRLYRVAYGNSQPNPNPNPDPGYPGEETKLPNYSVFLNDRARVIGGADLAQKLLDLANAFVQRTEFVTRYPGSLNGPGFIDALLASLKNDLGVDLMSQRDGLVALFNSGGRGAVLYRLADENQTNPINNRALIDAEYNRTFVATEYFGYLRRNPDMPGYLFWLGQVNSAPLRDISKQHAMVCSFITSGEYLGRFSPIITHSNAECPH